MEPRFVVREFLPETSNLAPPLGDLLNDTLVVQYDPTELASVVSDS
jgi:hypothetical protein